MVGKKVAMAVTGIVLVGFAHRAHARQLEDLPRRRGHRRLRVAFLRTMGEPLFPYSALLWGVRSAGTATGVAPKTSDAELGKRIAVTQWTPAYPSFAPSKQ